MLCCVVLCWLILCCVQWPRCCCSGLSGFSAEAAKQTKKAGHGCSPHSPLLPTHLRCWCAAVAGDLHSELLRRLITPGELFPDMGAALAEMQVWVGGWAVHQRE